MDDAARIYNELLHERASLWYVSDEYGYKIMIKAPSTAVKALIKGCKMLFFFGKDTIPVIPVFHTAVRIFDDPVHHLTISGVDRFLYEHRAVEKIMQYKEIPVQIYNELNICVATAIISFNVKNRQQVLSLLGDPTKLYIGELTKAIDKSLDCFAFSIDSTQEFADVHQIETVSVEGEIKEWKIIHNTIIGLNDQEKIIIDDLKEGEIFEQLVWAPTQSLFGHDVIKRPQIKSKQRLRELTDLLAYSEYGIFLFESKALAVLAVSSEISMERKVSNLKKDIKKGIRQLIGAAKKIQEKNDVYDLDGKAIEFDKTICPHCVILVSELLPFGEWQEIELMIFEAMLKQPMYLNVIDLKEFMQFVGYSQGSKYKLDYFLIERVKLMVENKSIFIQTNFIEEK